MFVSFFPRPKMFFISAVLWTALAMAVWYGYASQFFQEAEKPIGVDTFWTAPALWFDVYFTICVAIFAAPWMLLVRHRWSMWSILGSALILFTSYFQVQVSVAINAWFGPFYDLIQAAVSKPGSVTTAQLYGYSLTFAGIATVGITVSVLTLFFVSHYIFRWRTAMNDYYIENWPQLRGIEGASQRVQEDTMRFATTVESLGVNLIEAVCIHLEQRQCRIGRRPVNGARTAHLRKIPYPTQQSICNTRRPARPQRNLCCAVGVDWHLHHFSRTLHNHPQFLLGIKLQPKQDAKP